MHNQNGVIHLNYKNYKQKYWGRDVVIAIQNYTWEIWKMQNKKLHGKDAKESREIKLHKCRERIQVLYKMDRTCLSMHDKKIFKLLVHLRKRMGLSAMNQWIETAEYIFQKRLNQERRKELT